MGALRLLILAVLIGPAASCVCCSSLPCPYAVPKGERPGCWSGAVDDSKELWTAAAANSSTGLRGLQTASTTVGEASMMGWYSPSATLTTEFDEGLCLVPPDPSTANGGVRECAIRPAISGATACSRAWETNPLEWVDGVAESSVQFRGKVGQLLFGLHTSAADVGAAAWQFGFCADGSGLFAGTQGNWDASYKLIASKPPSDSDVLKIAFSQLDKTVHFSLNGKDLLKLPWEPPAGVKFYAHVAIQSSSRANPAPKGGGKPYTGPNDPRFLAGAICSMRGDDSWQVCGGCH